jgi:hypothetical protein
MWLSVYVFQKDAGGNQTVEDPPGKYELTVPLVEPSLSLLPCEERSSGARGMIRMQMRYGG